MDERVPNIRQSHTASEPLMTARESAAMLSVNERTVAGRIPTPPTSLIGREGEVAAIRELLHPPQGHRLVVLTGPGGVGKTRLALLVAAEAANVFADGVDYIHLAPILDPALVAAGIANAVGVRETGSKPLAEQIVAQVSKWS
jgi:hypothetical protein